MTIKKSFENTLRPTRRSSNTRQKRSRRASPFSSVAASCIFFAAAIASAQPDDLPRTPTQAQLDQITRAISQLGSSEPAQRSAARDELTKFGELAIPELEKAARFESTRDHEVQSRAAELVENSRSNLAKAKAKKFIAGQAVLSGWPEFASICGDNPSSRELYQKIHLNHSQQIETAIRQPQDLTFADFSSLLGSQNRERIALGLFLLAYPNAAAQPALQTNQLEVLSRNLIGSAGQFFDAKQKHQTSMIKLVCAFLASTDNLPPARKLALLSTLDHPLVDAQLLDLTQPNLPPIVRAVAIASLSSAAGPTTLKHLQQYIDDKTSVGKFLIDNPQQQSTSSAVTPKTKKQTVSEVQIRDICLLASLRITKKKPTDFGFFESALSTNSSKIDIKTAGFVDDTARQNAFKQWFRSQEKRPPSQQ